MNLLIEIRPEISPGSAEKGDFGERVCESVSEPSTAPARLKPLVDIAPVIGQLPAAERGALRSILSLVQFADNGSR